MVGLPPPCGRTKREDRDQTARPTVFRARLRASERGTQRVGRRWTLKRWLLEPQAQHRLPDGCGTSSRQRESACATARQPCRGRVATGESGMAGARATYWDDQRRFFMYYQALICLRRLVIPCQKSGDSQALGIMSLN